MYVIPLYMKRPHSTWSRMSSESQSALHGKGKKKRNQRLHSTAMPAITIFIPFIMALSVPYRIIDSGDIIYSPKEPRYRGASNGPVQFVDRPRECEQSGQLLLILQFVIMTLWIYAVDTSVLQYAHTHTHRVAEVFLCRTNDLPHRGQQWNISSEAKIFRYDSSRSKEYFTVNLDTNTVEMTQVSRHNCMHVHIGSVCTGSYGQ